MRDVTLPLRLDAETWIEAGRGVAVQEHVLSAGIALHWHTFFELSYVTGGAGEHTMNGAVGPLRPGDVLALTPADFHEVRPDPGVVLRITNVIYTDEVLPAALRAALPAAPTLHLPELAADFQRMLAESRRTDAVSALALTATLTRVLADVVRSAGPGDPARSGTGRTDVQRALVWIDHHFREPVRLADVAAVARLSPHHFSGVFRHTTGLSFREYVIRRRLRFARGLLATSDLPVTEVSHAAGFNDLTHFSRSYRRHFGHPPSAHRG